MNRNCLFMNIGPLRAAEWRIPCTSPATMRGSALRRRGPSGTDALPVNHISTHIYPHVFLHAYMHVHTRLHGCVYTCLHTRLYTCLHTSVYTYPYTYSYTCPYTCPYTQDVTVSGDRTGLYSAPEAVVLVASSDFHGTHHTPSASPTACLTPIVDGIPLHRHRRPHASHPSSMA